MESKNKQAGPSSSSLTINDNQQQTTTNKQTTTINKPNFEYSMSRSDYVQPLTGGSTTTSSNTLPRSKSTQLPSVLTRSMSRKTPISNSSSSNNNNIGILRESIIRRPSSVKSIPTSSTGPHRTLSSSSSSRPPAPSRSLAGTAPRRSILCELNDVKPSTNITTETSKFKCSIKARPRSSSTISGATPSIISGQKSSPTKLLVGARDSLLLKRDEAGDPFSLNFRPEIVVARTVGANHKRGFQVEEEQMHIVDENGRREIASHFSSPAKRSHHDHVDPPQMATYFESTSFTFTSPKKSAAKSKLTTPKIAPPTPIRQQSHHDNFDTMDIDIPASVRKPTHRMDNYRNIDLPSSSPAPPLFTTTRKKHPASNDSSEDEIDFLSPRKKPRSDNYNAAVGPTPSSKSSNTHHLHHHQQQHQPPRFSIANSTSMLRSPPKKFPSSPAKPRTSTFGPTSVPMSRPSFALPPLPTFNRRSSTVITPILTTIDPQVLTSIPIPEGLISAISLARPSVSSSSSTSTSSSSFAYGPSSAVGPRKSGIPRLVPTTSTTTSSNTTIILSPTLPPSHQPIQAPTLPSISFLPTTVNPSIFSSYTPPTLFDSVELTSNAITSTNALAISSEEIVPDENLDQTFNSNLDLDTTMGDFSSNLLNTSLISNSSNISVGGGMSDETAKRLAKLQSMLSKLQMPRNGSSSSSTSFSASAGGVSASSTPSSSQEMREATRSSTSSSRGGKMLPPMITGGVGKERKENLGRDRRRQTATSTSSSSSNAGNFREEYTVPISGGVLTSDPNLATTMKRLERSTSSSRSHASTSNYDSARSSLGIGHPPPLFASSSNNSSHTGTTRPPRRTSTVATGTSTVTISAIAEGELSAKPKSTILRGVVAFVDVRTLEGDDAGMIFVDMLKSMGARVTTRPTLTLTHIIYKSGRPGTLHRLRAHPDPKPFLVGISWVVNCCEKGVKVDEKNYTVESGNQPIVHKRRRSMEPKAFASLSSSLGAGGTTATDSTLKATIAASIERARRKSLQFQPRIGSPLAKRVFLMPAEETDEEEMTS